MKTWMKALCLGIVLAFSAPAIAAVSIPFTVNLSEAVTVDTTGGTPRIAVDVGGITRYATYTSGSGTNTLIFTYTMVSGDVDLDGVTLSSPIQLNGGTIKDLVGNNAALTFAVPNTSGVIINAAVPSGYTVAFADRTVTNANMTALSFSLTYPKANKTLNYSIASSGGGAPITGTVTTAAGTTTVNGIDATTLPDGKLTLSAYLTDSIGGTGVTVTDIIPKAVLDASLIGHWTFDASDISGTTAFDRSGQGNNGTLTNGPTQTTGKVGGALNFDGVNDWVNIPSNAQTPIGASARTVAFWIYTVPSTWASNVNTPFEYGVSGTRNAFGFDMDVYPIVEYYAWVDGFSAPSGALSQTGWLQVVVRYDGSTNYIGYINGVQVGARILGGILNTINTNINIGRSSLAGSYYFGYIDDVRIYNRALTPAEITTLYNATQ
jgi:hypothetical protein